MKAIRLSLKYMLSESKQISKSAIFDKAKPCHTKLTNRTIIIIRGE
jgi:predicted DNA-binding protein YlxM (UPF0122 family)